MTEKGMNRRRFVRRAAGAAAGAALAPLLGCTAEAGRSADAAGDAEKPAENDWTPLFNGKDLAGWTTKAPGKFKVDDGCLVGSQTDGKGGDLYTEKQFGDFELRFTYRVTWPANSGVWFRGRYQYDILKWKKPVAFGGSLYCPGKMFITRNLDEKLENRDGWNEGQVFALGDHLILWLNGKKVGECHDKTHAKGPIGIQVHPGGGFKGMEIRIRRIEIRPLAKGDTPTPPRPRPKHAPRKRGG